MIENLIRIFNNIGLKPDAEEIADICGSRRILISLSAWNSLIAIVQMLPH